MQKFVSCHHVTLEYLSHCYNSNLLHFELQVLHCSIKLRVSHCSKELWIVVVVAFQAINFVVTFQAMGFALLHFELQVLHYCISSYQFCITTFRVTSFVFHLLCFIVVFWAWNYFTVVCFPHLVCNNNFKTLKIEPLSFSFLFFPFDWSCISFMECLWTLCIFFLSCDNCSNDNCSRFCRSLEL